MGKLSNKQIAQLLSCIRTDSRIIVPPAPGFDSGVHMINGKYLVVSTDPCIGAPMEWFGWLLVNYAASDVALFGAKPEFCTINLLGPTGTKANKFLRIMKQVCEACNQLDIVTVTGHTGRYDAINEIIGTCTAYGTVEKNKLLTPAKAEAGDLILCVKNLGLETVVNLAYANPSLTRKLFGRQRTEELKQLVGLQSCVIEAQMLANIAGVHAMHDTAEGGLVAALNEIAYASKVGFTVQYEDIPIPEEIRVLQRHFCLSNEKVLSVSSTGTVIAAIHPRSKEKTLKELSSKGVAARVIGNFTQDSPRILLKNSKKHFFPRTADDPYQMILSGKV